MKGRLSVEKKADLWVETMANMRAAEKADRMDSMRDASWE